MRMVVHYLRPQDKERAEEAAAKLADLIIDLPETKQENILELALSPRQFNRVVELAALEELTLLKAAESSNLLTQIEYDEALRSVVLYVLRTHESPICSEIWELSKQPEKDPAKLHELTLEFTRRYGRLVSSMLPRYLIQLGYANFHQLHDLDIIREEGDEFPEFDRPDDEDVEVDARIAIEMPLLNATCLMAAYVKLGYDKQEEE